MTEKLSLGRCSLGGTRPPGGFYLGDYALSYANQPARRSGSTCGQYTADTSPAATDAL
jgi:hypothetical protein